MLFDSTKKIKKQSTDGFTLVEVLVAMSIFLIVITSGVSALLSVYEAYGRTRNQRQVLAQIGVLVEGMSRSIRTGRYVTCGETSADPATFPTEVKINCFTQTSAATAISFLDQSGRVVEYRIVGSVLQRSINNAPFIDLTDSTIVTIESFTVYVRGAIKNPTAPTECTPMQPYTLLSISGRSVQEFKGQPYRFTIQSGSAQRYLDVPDTTVTAC